MAAEPIILKRHRWEHSACRWPDPYDYKAGQVFLERTYEDDRLVREDVYICVTKDWDGGQVTHHWLGPTKGSV